MSLLALARENKLGFISIWHMCTLEYIQTITDFIEIGTWSRIADLLDLCLWRRSTRPAMISLGTMSRSLKNSAKRLATSEYASWTPEQQILEYVGMLLCSNTRFALQMT